MVKYTEILKRNVLETFDRKSVLSINVHAIRIGTDVWFPADDISVLTQMTPSSLVGYAGTARSRQIERASIVNHPLHFGPDDYVNLDVVKALLKNPYHGWCDYTPLRDWIKKEVLGYPSIIKSGAWIGARLLHQSLGVTESFSTWKMEVARRNPKKVRGTGFQHADRKDSIDDDSDFPVALNLAEYIARQEQTYGGMILFYVITCSDFNTHTLLQEPFATTLENYREFLPNHLDLVDAQKLGELLDFDPATEDLAETFSVTGEKDLETVFAGNFAASHKPVSVTSSTDTHFASPAKSFYRAAAAKEIVVNWPENNTYFAMVANDYFHGYPV